MSEPVFISEMFSSIQGEGMLVGRRQIFVRLMECNLNCTYCDTDFAKSDVCKVEAQPGRGSFKMMPQPLPLSRVAAIVDEWQQQVPGGHHSISFTGGEPLLHAETLGEWLPHLRSRLPVYLETNGTMHVALRYVKPHLDYISMDMKLPSTAGCTEHLWDLHALFLEEALGCAVSVKIVVDNSTPEDEIVKVCDVITSVDGSVPLFIQPLTLADGRVGIAAGQLMHFQELASARLTDVRVIPQMHKLLGAL